ncbi:ABC transporter permease [Bacillus salitolerans]|uniref:ABC transporter permease n=1 Tax=Bacillus salitolerans TaxID=1437434 RepID=A0ABW4LQL1_9BACI
MWLTVSATFTRNFLIMRRAYPWSFFIGHILSGTYVVIFAYLTYFYVFEGDMDSRFNQLAGTNDYISYTILGGLLFSFSVSLLMIVSRTLITEFREGTLDSLLLTPSSRNGYFLGATAQGLMRLGLEFLAIILVGGLFGLSFYNVNVLGCLVILFVLIFATFSQSLVLGGFMLYFRDTYITQNTLFVLMGLVCSITFPTEYLPLGVHWIGEMMPLTHGVDAFRQMFIEGTPITEVKLEIFKMIGLGFIYLLVGMVLIRRMEKFIIEKHFG